MEMMTLTKEQRELKAMAPATAQAAGARVRELTPAQRRAVMFAQQQVQRKGRGVFGVPFRSGARPEGGQFRTAVVHRAVLGAVHSPDASHGG